VAVLKLDKPLSVGDKIKISGHDNEFTQEVVSMQMEHQQIKKAKKGDDIGLKVDRPVKENDEVYKVT
jgi:putative protease